MTESFKQLFEESIAGLNIKAGVVMNGTVVDIDEEHVLVYAGLKSEGYVPADEFRNGDGDVDVVIGDRVEVALTAIENGVGETELSHEKALSIRNWKVLEQAFLDKETVEGKIKSRVKGGFIVDLGRVEAFLPGSLLDVRPQQDSSYLEGKDLQFKVIKFDPQRNNIVVSRTAVMEGEHHQRRAELLQRLEKGQILKGVVKNLTDYGAFLDLGGVDGLLHVTDMSWKRLSKPSDAVQVGDEMDVKVLSFDPERGRVSLGLKQMAGDPLDQLLSIHPIGSKLKGKVTNITEYGCFVEIQEGLEGLVHVSEMDWVNRNIQPAKLVKLGQEVDVMILNVDNERRRVSLSMKQCRLNPWEEFRALHGKGERLKVTIKSITDFGIFVGLDGGIDGMIHISDLSWTEAGEDAIRKYSKGDELEAIVLTIDSERERVALGIKQVRNDPLWDYLDSHERGSVVKGQVVSVEQRLVKVDLGNGVIGQIRSSDLQRDKVDDARLVMKEGDEVEAKLTGITRRRRLINLSVRARLIEEEADSLSDYRQEGEATSKLGDIMPSRLKNETE